MISVTQGRIRVNSVAVLHQNEDVIVLEMDCRAKRGEIVGYGHGQTMHELILDANDDTLHTEDNDMCTVVSVHGLIGTWRSVAHYQRYTVTWVLYRSKEGKEIWTDD